MKQFFRKKKNAKKLEGEENVLTDVNKKWFIFERWSLMLHPKKHFLLWVALQQPSLF